MQVAGGMSSKGALAEKKEFYGAAARKSVGTKVGELKDLAIRTGALQVDDSAFSAPLPGRKL